MTLKDESYSEIESVYDSGDSYKPCRDDYHSSDSNLPLQSSDNTIKTEFYKKKKKKKKNQPHQSRKRESGKMIVKTEA